MVSVFKFFLRSILLNLGGNLFSNSNSTSVSKRQVSHEGFKRQLTIVVWDSRNITNVGQDLSQRIFFVFSQLLDVGLAQIVNQDDLGELNDDGVLLLFTKRSVLVDLKVFFGTRYARDVLKVLLDLRSVSKCDLVGETYLRDLRLDPRVHSGQFRIIQLLDIGKEGLQDLGNGSQVKNEGSVGLNGFFVDQSPHFGFDEHKIYKTGKNRQH